jgi:hypothetical protein
MSGYRVSINIITILAKKTEKTKENSGYKISVIPLGDDSMRR